MIAKRILAPKGGSGFQRLSGYVLNVREEHREASDPASWTRLSAYILDAEHTGEKVAWARASNCANEDLGWAVKEILAIQARNTRARSDKSYHLVVSFPEGERPSRAQLEDIEDRLCEALGFAEHQRVSAVHQNTDNWHLHVAINKVHPTTFRNLTPLRDHYRLQAACAELEIRHALAQEPHTLDPRQSRKWRTRGRAGDFEARHGGQSFLSWTQDQARPALLSARDAGAGWDGLHRIAATFDLVLKLRGAGLVIGHRSDRRLHVRASDVDRGLSLKALTDRLGPYQPPGAEVQAEQPEQRYERPARSGSLYEAFQREREEALRQREAAMADLRTRHTAYAGELAAWYRDRVREEKARPHRGALRRESVQHIAEQRRQDRQARIAREREERRRVREAHPIPSWQSYLEAEAAGGNEEALKVLRGRQRRAQRIESDILTAENAEAARHILHQHMQPVIRRDGRVIYRVADGGLVSDEARQVRVPRPSAGAALLALSLAAERFGERPLVVKGTAEFRAQLAKVAGIEGLHVSFADPELERQRTHGRIAAQKTVDRSPNRTDITHS